VVHLTPRCRYRDISDVLQQLALHLGKSSATLRIYDPYFCEGSVILHLRALGFSNVYNRNEDFYARAAGSLFVAAVQLISSTQRRWHHPRIRRARDESPVQRARAPLRHTLHRIVSLTR
jgi:hypothetical protein